MPKVTLGRTGITVDKNGFGALPIQRIPVEDAVYLAVREVEKSGDEVDEDTIREALKNVLKRHPSWKNTEKQKTGIKVGADAEGSEGNSKKASVVSG